MLTGLLAGSAQDVTVGETTISYADLLAAASGVAAAVEGLDRVAVRAAAVLPTVVAVVGGVLAGVQVVPVPPDSGVQEREHLVRDSGAQAWVGPDPGTTPLPWLRVEPGRRAAYRARAHDPSRVALVLYTSGTTGPPKGVPLTRRALAVGLDGLADAWAWTGADVLAHGLPLCHVHGLVLGVLGPLRRGGGVIHVGRPTPAAYAAVADRATMYFGVPTVWSRIADAPRHAAALAPARLLVSGSAALPAPVFDRIEALTGHRVAERYGMTETLITVATRADGPRRAGSVGVPIAGVRTRLRDEADVPVAHDGATVGRLQVRGATVFDGYLGRPQDTATAFTADGWFRTGDLATIGPDGVHRIVGRESVDLIKSGGYRIGAGEIEAVLLGHPGVGECAVVGLPDPDLGQRIVAYVVPRGDARSPAPDGAALAAYVGEQLSAHKRPREVRFVDALPRNEMGKVLKGRLTR
ncbi:MAG: AMP-binding protein [Dermatophilaceae bacterium]